VVGQVVALEAGTGPRVYVGTRMASKQVNEVTDKFVWAENVYLYLKEETCQAVRKVHTDLPTGSGNPIRAPHLSITLGDKMPRDTLSHLKRKLPNFNLQADRIAIASDASDSTVASFGVGGLPDFEYMAELSPTQRTWLSSQRELTAIYLMLANCKLLDMGKPATMFSITDNTNISPFLTKDSGKPEIMTQVMLVLSDSTQH
jgi:hypothetical protein